MNRWSAYGRLDTSLRSDGDAVFTGIDMTRDRGSLPPGMIARGENNRMRQGTCERRPGNILPGEFQAPFDNIITGSAITGRFVSEQYARKHPKTTIRERIS